MIDWAQNVYIFVVNNQNFGFEERQVGKRYLSTPTPVVKSTVECYLRYLLGVQSSQAS